MLMAKFRELTFIFSILIPSRSHVHDLGGINSWPDEMNASSRKLAMRNKTNPEY